MQCGISKVRVNFFPPFSFFRNQKVDLIKISVKKFSFQVQQSFLCNWEENIDFAFFKRQSITKQLQRETKALRAWSTLSVASEKILQQSVNNKPAACEHRKKSLLRKNSLLAAKKKLRSWN